MSEKTSRLYLMRSLLCRLGVRFTCSWPCATPLSTRKILVQLILLFLNFLLEVTRHHSPAMFMGIALLILEGLGKIEAATIGIDLGPSRVLSWRN